MDASGKTRLECSYHGWQFAGCGKCTKLPQLEGTKPILPLYGASAYWCFLHLGPRLEEERAARPPLSTAALFAEPEGEATRYVRLLRVVPAPLRFSA